MGQQQMRTKAEAAFREVVKEKSPNLAGGELEELESAFHKKLL